MKRSFWVAVIVATIFAYTLHPVGRMFFVMPISVCWWVGQCDGPLPAWAYTWIEKGWNHVD